MQPNINIKLSKSSNCPQTINIIYSHKYELIVKTIKWGLKMTDEKIKLGLLIGFIGVTLIVLAISVPISTIYFALLIGLLFILPLLALVSIVIIGVSMVSKKPGEPSIAEKEEVVIPT